MPTSLIKFLIDPFNILWLLLLTSIIAWYMNKIRAFRWLIGMAIGWFLISSTPFLPIIIINSLEDRYEPVNVEQLEERDVEYHILVLGGGHGFDDRLPPNSLLLLNALGRLNEGIRLHLQLPNSKLVLSGFSSSGRTTQAEVLQKTALLLGVDESATIIQPEPGNTRQEAETYAGNYGSTHPVILVTSATHMPRAVMLFKLYGIDPIPSPTNYRLRGSWKRKRFGLPSMANIEHLRAGMFEYAAIFEAKVRGG